MGVSFRSEKDIGFIEFDLPDAKVNLLSSTVMQKLDKILDTLKDNTSFRAVVIMSKKKDVFIAGADIKEIEDITETSDAQKKSQIGQNVFNKLEDLKVPTVAVIDGVTLGGGCELILSCQYRIATFNEKVKIGLPEVNLGIIPGFGGTYRMPRVVGLMQGIKLVTSGKPVSSQAALKIGLVDRLYPQVGLDQEVFNFIDEITQGSSKKRFLHKKSKRANAFLENNPLGRAVLFNQAKKSILKATKGFYPAPLKALDVLRKTRCAGRAQGLKVEARAFSELGTTPISKNLISFFYLSEKYRKLTPPEIKDVAPKNIEKCAVIGAGIMGGGIAQLLSYKGIRVRLKDINFDAVASGLKTAQKVFHQAVKRRRMTKEQAHVQMNLITGTLDYSGFKSVDMVIEAIVEDLGVKKKVFHELSEVAPPGAVLCSNTSALSVTEMAKETKDPSRVIGLHFFNPVHRMPLIEIVKTDLTSPQTIATTINLAKRMNKTPILVQDSCGFLVNRILLGYINEAGRILEERGSIEEIDRIMTEFGMPMGPFLLSDEVGLDVGIKVLHILEEGLGERFKAVDIFEKVYDKKFLGKKTQKGFYCHQKKRIPNHDVHSLLPQDRAGSVQKEEALNRMILIMVNEAARCLEEKIIDEPGAVDIGMVMGTGFPAFRGGLLRYADSIGIEKVVELLKDFNSRLDACRFQPCQYLLDLYRNKKGFYSS